MPRESKYDSFINEASTHLRSLSSTCCRLEDEILEFLERPSDVQLCTKLVQGLLDAKRLSLELVTRYIPELEICDEALADAVKIAHDEILEKVLGIETDMNRMVSRHSSTPPRAPAPVIRLRSA
jgi:hypothetical protein